MLYIIITIISQHWSTVQQSLLTIFCISLFDNCVLLPAPANALSFISPLCPCAPGLPLRCSGCPPVLSPVDFLFLTIIRTTLKCVHLFIPRVRFLPVHAPPAISCPFLLAHLSAPWIFSGRKERCSATRMMKGGMRGKRREGRRRDRKGSYRRCIKWRKGEKRRKTRKRFI